MGSARLGLSRACRVGALEACTAWPRWLWLCCQSWYLRAGKKRKWGLSWPLSPTKSAQRCPQGSEYVSLPLRMLMMWLRGPMATSEGELLSFWKSGYYTDNECCCYNSEGSLVYALDSLSGQALHEQDRRVMETTRQQLGTK